LEVPRIFLEGIYGSASTKRLKNTDLTFEEKFLKILDFCNLKITVLTTFVNNLGLEQLVELRVWAQ
jgi:adenine-specific DNA methylase